MIVDVSFKELQKLLKAKASLEQVMEALAMFGTPVDDVQGDNLRVEVEPNRVDMLSAEGIARSLNGFLGAEVGYPQWKLVPGKLEVEREGSEIRPNVSFSSVLGTKLTEAALQGLMQMQEKLHLTVGRDRRKFSIGLYDLSKLASPITFKDMPLDDILFRPLGENSDMTGREALQKTEKGKRYAHLVGKDKAPVLVDGKGRILSMAPIINADFCRVTTKTTDFFIDSTGTQEGTDSMVAIVASALAERGGSIGVTMPGPSFLPERLRVTGKFVRDYLGRKIKKRTMRRCLEEMRYGYDGRVLIPPYRTDIFSRIDIAEDIAIAHGYGEFEGELLPAQTPGEPLAWREREAHVRRLMVGLGFLELKTFMLTSPDLLQLSGRYRLTVKDSKSREYSALRQSLLPGMFQVLQLNKDADYPQRVFETGTVFMPVEGRRLAGLVAHNGAGFSEIKGVVDRLVSSMGWQADWEGDEHPFFMPGRTAACDLGHYGEVRPRIAEKVGLPVAGFELNLDRAFSPD